MAGQPLLLLIRTVWLNRVCATSNSPWGDARPQLLLLLLL
jgi:hypothetical protein